MPMKITTMKTSALNENLCKNKQEIEGSKYGTRRSDDYCIIAGKVETFVGVVGLRRMPYKRTMEFEQECIINLR